MQAFAQDPPQHASNDGFNATRISQFRTKENESAAAVQVPQQSTLAGF